MKVEIWSDFVCPFCYIGKRKFEAALDQFPNKRNVEVVYRSFELDPQAERDVDYDVHERLARKYNMSREQAKAMNDNVGEQAKAVGLDYRFDSMISTNTFDAHRLAHFAARQGKQHEMTERLLQAYFTDGKHIGDHNTLAALAGEAGLDQSEAARVLAGGEYGEDVRHDERDAQSLGINGVPYFVINRKYGISGAQPTEVFMQVLEQVWQEENPSPVLNELGGDSAGAVCTDGVCAPADRKPS